MTLALLHHKIFVFFPSPALFKPQSNPEAQAILKDPSLCTHGFLNPESSYSVTDNAGDWFFGLFFWADILFH